MPKKKYDRKKMGKELLKRTEESYRKKDDSGRFKDYLEGDFDRFKPKEGDHIVDIIPFVAGANHPTVEEGESAYVLDVWAHQKVGPNEESIICPARTFEKPCPICEYQAELRKDDDFDEDEVKALNPKRRVVYNVICYDSAKEEQKGVQIWEAAHYCVEKNILAIARKKRGGGFVQFMNPGDEDNPGVSVAFTREGSGATNTKYLGYTFEEREEMISDEDLEDAFVLDELMKVYEYDKIKELFEAGYSDDADNGGDDDEDEEEAPRRKSRVRKAKKKDDDDDEEEKPSRRRRRSKKDEDEDEEEEEKPSRRRRRSKKDDDEEEEEKPSRRRRRPKKEEPEDEPEEDEPEEDEPEEEEKPSRRRRRPKKEEPEDDEPEDEEDGEPEDDEDGEPEDDEPEDEDDGEVGPKDCIGGGSFGRDHDQLDECPDCPNWDACSDEAEALRAKKKKAKSSKGGGRRRALRKK